MPLLVLSIFPCRTVSRGFQAARYTLLFSAVIRSSVSWARRGRFPFVLPEETNCSTSSSSPAYPDCLVVREYRWCFQTYPGSFSSSFSVGHSPPFPSPAHTRADTRTLLPPTRTLLPPRAHLWPLRFLWFQIEQSVPTAGTDVFACQVLAWAEFSMPKF